MAERLPDFTPVDLITGFLGSGKTTLLRRLLADPALADTAVLINEFGEVGLDHLLLERIDETMVLLQSGCLCCSIREELADAMQNLLARRESGEVPPFRRLVVESTGLADPFPILSTIHAHPVLKHHFRIGNVIATVDAVNAQAQIARQFETVKQIAAADRIVITKTDLTDDKTVEQLRTEIRRINPDAPIWSNGADAVESRLLLSDVSPVSSRRREKRKVRAEPDGHHHHAEIHGDVTSFSVVVDRPIDWIAFGLWLTMLLNRHGAEVLRVKGILNVAGWDRPVAIHGVQHLVHPPEHMKAWPNGDRRSRIVFIVRGLDRKAIERSLAAFNALGESQLEAVG
jgi:G3E family GTPase